LEEIFREIDNIHHSGVAAATATKGIGQAAITFFIEQSPTETAKKKMGW